MASITTCAWCLRTLHRQSIPQGRRITTRLASRSFTTTSRHYLEPEYNVTKVTPVTSIPPVTPERAEGGSKSTSKPTASKTVQELKKLTGRATETYTAYGATEILYKECAVQADYSIPQAKDKDAADMPKTADGEDLGIGEGWWHTEAGLQPTFSTWSQVTMLHMYLLSARFRCFPASAKTWQQHLVDHFFYDAENKMMIEHNMHARGTRNKYLKDMYVQWRGLLMAYDEGLARGDSALAAAIWRNVFKADPDVNIRALAQITSYMRKDLSKLDRMSDDNLMMADWAFGSPAGEKDLVTSKSQMMDLPFEKAPGKDLTG